MRRKAGIDFHAQRFGLLAQPFAEIGQADDVVAADCSSAAETGNAEGVMRAGFGEEAEAVVGHRRLQRRALLLPVRDQFVQRAGIDHRAGQDMRPDLRALFQARRR